jgi:hypothetical protein
MIMKSCPKIALLCSMMLYHRLLFCILKNKDIVRWCFERCAVPESLDVVKSYSRQKFLFSSALVENYIFRLRIRALGCWYILPHHRYYKDYIDTGPLYAVSVHSWATKLGS